MLKVKDSRILQELGRECDRYNLTPEIILQFCEAHNYTFGIIKLNEDGLFFSNNDGSLTLDFLGELLSATGVFNKYSPSDNNEELLEELDKYLDEIDNNEYDLIFINEPNVKIPGGI